MDELAKKLRYCGNAISCYCCPYWEGCGGSKEELTQAADAIEELSRLHEAQRQNLIAMMNEGPEMERIPIESRPMDEEERQYYSEHFGYDLTVGEAIIYCPDYGVGFETNGDMDGIVAWMPTPKPYKPPKEKA